MAWIGQRSAGWPRRSLSRRAPRFPETERPAPMTVSGIRRPREASATISTSSAGSQDGMTLYTRWNAPFTPDSL